MERKVDFISTSIRYKKETEVVTFQGREITLENLSPVFTPEQEAAKRRELEQQLYEVFRKYADKRQKEGYCSARSAHFQASGAGGGTRKPPAADNHPVFRIPAVGNH